MIEQQVYGQTYMIKSVRFGQLTVGEAEPTRGVLPLCRAYLDAFVADEPGATIEYFSGWKLEG